MTSTVQLTVSSICSTSSLKRVMASPVDPGTAVAPGSSRIRLIRLIRSRDAMRNRKFTSFQMATKMFDYPEDGVAEEQRDQRGHVERRPGHPRSSSSKNHLVSSPGTIGAR